VFLCRMVDVFLGVLMCLSTFWKSLLFPSSVQLNLVQVNAELVRKNGLCPLCGNAGRNLTNQSCGKEERMSLVGSFGSEFQEHPL
jgi:hypothetical protein